MRFLRLHIYFGDAGAGKDVMELVQQQLLPEPVRPGQVILHALLHGNAAPKLHLPHGKLAAAVVLLDHGLGSVCPSVGAEV